MNETALPDGFGVAIALVRPDGRILMMLRRGARGAGTWGLPGGKPERGESVRQAARRELREECGVDVAESFMVEGPQLVDIIEGRRWTTAFVSVEVPQGLEGRIMEPDKCEAMGWFGPVERPSPLFAPMTSLFAGGFEPPFRRAQ